MDLSSLHIELAWCHGRGISTYGGKSTEEGVRKAENLWVICAKRVEKFTGGVSPTALNCEAVGFSKLGMELARGIEPPTSGLQNRCSAIELRQPGKIFTHFPHSRKPQA
jgi:hypothetical protein